MPERTAPVSKITDRMEKAQLRSMVHEDVRKMCVARRERLWSELTEEHPDWSQQQVEARLDVLQPVYDDYDPVVAMAVVSANHEYPIEVRLRAMAESSQYLRPKLKSVELTVDPLSPEERARRSDLAARLVGLLDVAAEAKQGTVIDGTVASPAPPDTVGADASPSPAPTVGAMRPPAGESDESGGVRAAEDPTSGAGRVDDRG